MYLAVELGPKLMTVASSPSPYPSSAAPVFQPVLSVLVRQAVPWLEPLSRYRHALLPAGIKGVSACTAGANQLIRKPAIAASKAPIFRQGDPLRRKAEYDG